MNDRQLGQLNDRQKQCLRLYYTNLEAKEIALELGLSPHTVNEHLRDARRILGVARSMQAARLLVEAEGDNRIVSEPFGVDRPSDSTDSDGASQPPVRPASYVRNRYKLGILARIGLIIAIAFIAVALAGALLVGAEAITRIFVDYRIDISDPPYRN